MHIDQLFDAIKNDEPLSIPASWGQGRAVFGGLLTSLVFQKMQTLIPSDMQIHNISTSFIAPLAADTPCVISAQTLRVGKNVAQLEGQITQNGQITTKVLASFGLERTSVIHNQGPAIPDDVRALELCELIPLINNITPAFLEHIDIQKAIGSLPFTGGSEREIAGWMGLKQPSIAFGLAHFIALVDAWPPTVLSQLNQFATASTLTWTLSFMQPIDTESWLDASRDSGAPLSFYYHAHVIHCASGYGQTSANIWSKRGDLIASSTQTVTVFA